MNRPLLNRRKKSDSRAYARLFVLLAAVCTALLIGGCSIAETILDETAAPKMTPDSASIVVIADESPAEPSATPEAEASMSAEEAEAAAAEEALASAEPEEALEEESVSSTTGRPLPEGAVYRPVLAVIDNAALARPQTGLMLADVVYEFPLDRSDHSTRFLAVFADEIPARIGPVQTSRDYLAETAMEWDGLYISLGDPEDTSGQYPLLEQSGVRFHAENSKDAADFFYRDKTVSSDDEHTMFFKPLDYAEEHYNFTAALDGERFAFESGVTYEKGKAFSSVGLSFTSSDSYRVVYTYDDVTNRLTRSDKNSKNVLTESSTLTPTDDMIGYASESITVQNLIVQYVRVSALDTTFRNVDVVGSGNCDYFINGRYITGTWSRASEDEPTTYRLYDGTVVRLEPGNTWIEMMPSSKQAKIRYSA